MATNSQVAHRWAQDNGRPIRGHSVFFERRETDYMGPVQTIFSYGMHFPVAAFVTAPNGERVVLANLSERRSVTTSRHQREARRAIPPGVRVFDVANPDPLHSDGNYADFHSRNLLGILARAQQHAARALRRRDPDYRATDQHNARHELATAVDYAATWGLPAVPSDLTAALEHMTAVAAAEREAYRIARAEREARNAAREAALRIEQAPDFLAWQRGERLRAPSCWTIDDATGSAYVRRHGDELQTSRGACVPWEHAVKAFRLIRAVRARGEIWSSPPAAPVRVGHFRVDRIDAEGNMRAGCHFFAWAEMLALADREGVR
jgi:hypothetical protein